MIHIICSINLLAREEKLFGRKGPYKDYEFSCWYWYTHTQTGCPFIRSHFVCVLLYASFPDETSPLFGFHPFLHKKNLLLQKHTNHLFILFQYLVQVARLMQIFILDAVPWIFECICSKQVSAAKGTSLCLQNEEVRLESVETSVLTLESTMFLNHRHLKHSQNETR